MRGAATGAGVKGWVCPVVKGEGWEEVVGGPGPWVLWDVAGGSLVLRGHRKAAEACMVDTYPLGVEGSHACLGSLGLLSCGEGAPAACHNLGLGRILGRLGTSLHLPFLHTADHNNYHTYSSDSDVAGS